MFYYHFCERRLILELIYALTGATLLAAGAKIRVLVPFIPVPFTLQTMILHYLLFTLGKRSWRCVLTYIALGLTGLPLFAFGGGFAYVFSPTFGYIVGFLAGTIIAGRIAPTGALSWRQGLVAGLTQLAIVYILGASWLTSWYIVLRGLSYTQALALAVMTGEIPFIAWDLVKLLAAIPLSRLTVVLLLSLTKYSARMGTIHLKRHSRTH